MGSEKGGGGDKKEQVLIGREARRRGRGERERSLDGTEAEPEEDREQRLVSPYARPKLLNAASH